jgi:predicted XRE-type DNA-binding protein
MKPRTREQASHTLGGPNVYTDLGYHDPDRMLIKAQLVSRLAELLAERGVSQIQAATSLGITQPALSKLLRGQFRGFLERKLVVCLARLGQDVHIAVHRKAKRTGNGSMSVT